MMRRRGFGVGREMFGVDRSDPSLRLYVPLWYVGLQGTSFSSMDIIRHVCTVTGALWIPGEGRDLDGGDDKIAIADVASLSAISPLSIEVWLKQDVQGTEGLVSKASGTPNSEWTLRLVNGNLRLYLEEADGVTYLQSTGSADISDAAWHHGAAVWDGTNAIGHIQTYADGVADVMTDDGGGTGFVAYDGSAALEIGRDLGNNNNCFDGMIGEVMVYNRVLSAAEILRHYRQTKWRYGV